MIEQAAVLGASGTVGKAVVDALVRQNIPTKALVRDVDKFTRLYPDGKPPGRLDILEGELDSNEAVALVCEYSDTIFPCFNTKFTNWEKDMTRWSSRTADIAAALGAKIIYPGNIYNFGKTKAKKITEEHPQKAHTVIGQLSIAIEQRYARSVAEGASLSIIRFPKIFGPSTSEGLIQKLFTSAVKGEPVIWNGTIDKEIEFIYSKDVGEILVNAALTPQASNVVLHQPGHTISLQKLFEMVYSTAGTLLSYEQESNWKKIKRSLTSRSLDIINELKYTFEEPLNLDGTKISQILGDRKLTSMDDAIAETVDWYKFWLQNSQE